MPAIKGLKGAALRACLLLCAILTACDNEVDPLPGRSQNEVEVPQNEVEVPSLASALQDCREAYAQLTTFRTELFADACTQGRSMVCAAARLSALKGLLPLEGSARDRSSPSPLDRLMSRQQFITVTAHYSTHIFRIPSASPYGYNCENFHAGNCEEHYKRPVPISTEARELESAALAEELALSVRRLRFYQEKLPELELDVSRITALETRLRKLEREANLAHAQPALAMLNIDEHKDVLNRIVRGIDDARQRMPLATSVSDEELQSILRTFQ